MWTTPFLKLLKLTSKDKTTETLSCSNPSTLAKNLPNYKQLAFQINDDRPGSFPCGNCAVCGNHGQQNRMIQHTEFIRCKTKYLNLKLKLNCKNYGIFVEECKTVICNTLDKLKLDFLYCVVHPERIGTNSNLKKTMNRLPY